MRRWQPISTVPLNTPVIVTDGRSRRIATLKPQNPVWRYEDENPPFLNLTSGLSQGAAYQFVPTHWFSLPKLPEAS